MTGMVQEGGALAFAFLICVFGWFVTAFLLFGLWGHLVRNFLDGFGGIVIIITILIFALPVWIFISCIAYGKFKKTELVENHVGKQSNG